MASHNPAIQVLSRQNYEDQHIVCLPNAYPLAPLKPSSIRVKPTIISLTTNNFSYARFGHMLGWWDIHPLPPFIPKEYADPESYGRISCWGYGEVIESNVPSVEKGTQVFGYLPIADLPVDMEIKVSDTVTQQFMEISKHRAHVLSIYNRYYIFPPFKTEEERLQSRDSQGLDSIFFLFATGYCMNRFLFPWNPAELVTPSGNPGDGWNLQKGTLGSNAVVLVFSASGKTGLSFAYNLKYGRPAGKLPRMVCGVGSARSKSFTESTGLYDKVLTYDIDSGDLTSELGLHEDSKIVICDFGARGGASRRWVAKLNATYKDVVQLGIGDECVSVTPEQATASFLARHKAGGDAKPTINASAIKDQAMGILGEQKYYDEFWKKYRAFKEQGAVQGLRLVWGNGMDDVGKGWESLYKGEVGPDEGLVFDLGGKSPEKL
ncbi:hypothetical protein ONS95_003917 [Cadophora gregata]|uniref:uncharacterized protein n=1 Tax=Cadophora gregata TaxID=51156 RepID=UPI0026DD1402|nr:uncharacterized protein ONS95_003917 [Cadophora gregata]KAK0107215.1 hypothetical protein ONS95_003917 [Cadophora gregata]KAK0116897.1 hypothetical protein ONS96_012743 [Cadophora gregata f. sp. sojae]